MSSEADARHELIESLEMHLRRFSVTAALTSSAVAWRLDINETDLRCMFLFEPGQEITAGDLAELSGLSTGAITGLIDRLERARLVERTRDPEDRRRVVIRHIPDAMDRIKQNWRPIREAMKVLWNDYSDTEIAFLADYYRRSEAVMMAARKRLKSASGNG